MRTICARRHVGVSEECVTAPAQENDTNALRCAASAKQDNVLKGTKFITTDGRDLRDKQDTLILNVGELITHRIIERTQNAERLDVLPFVFVENLP